MGCPWFLMSCACFQSHVTWGDCKMISSGNNTFRTRKSEKVDITGKLKKDEQRQLVLKKFMSVYSSPLWPCALLLTYSIVPAPHILGNKAIYLSICKYKNELHLGGKAECNHFIFNNLSMLFVHSWNCKKTLNVPNRKENTGYHIVLLLMYEWKDCGLDKILRDASKNTLGRCNTVIPQKLIPFTPKWTTCSSAKWHRLLVVLWERVMWVSTLGPLRNTHMRPGWRNQQEFYEETLNTCQDSRDAFLSGNIPVLMYKVDK